MQILQTMGCTLQFHQCPPVGESGHFHSPEARYSFSVTPIGFLEYDGILVALLEASVLVPVFEAPVEGCCGPAQRLPASGLCGERYQAVGHGPSRVLPRQVVEGVLFSR